MDHPLCVGIDLGTSNSALAIANHATGQVEMVEMPQFLTPNAIGERATLPSALYIPHRQEFPSGSLRLPWHSEDQKRVIGQFARNHGALVPDRLITSAKSWLSNPHIDPKKPMLPWQSDLEEGKYSPLDCCRFYLEHLKEGLFHGREALREQWDEAQVVVTVPASFDDIARNLTTQAAQSAGLAAILLEEPQAAFYAWTEAVGKEWRHQVAQGDVVLVCDVGGGTADFSLIAVSEREGVLALERISVGEHILLGGDNMDLALAHTLRARLEDAGKTLDDWQFLALIHAVSVAKITLFDDASLNEVPLAIPSRGSSLFAKTLSTVLDRTTLEQVVLEGFFPVTEITDLPQAGGGAGLQEFGLPYASDPVISKHLARFLTRSLTNVQASVSFAALVGDLPPSRPFLSPTAILFNGGVFKAESVRQRVLALIQHWNQGDSVRVLAGFQPDLAVAKGAAVYGRMRATGKGMRIKAGTARSYYIGLQSTMPAVPGFKPPIKALCVVPQGMEEGTEHLIEAQTFGLVTGRSAEFRFFSSEMRSGDQPGDILSHAERELEETSLLEINLPTLDDFPEGQAIPVQINAIVTPLGTLELWMKHTHSERRWKVEFQVRTE